MPSKRTAKIILNLAPALPLPKSILKQVDVLVLNEHEAAVLGASLRLAHDEVRDQVVALAGELRQHGGHHAWRRRGHCCEGRRVWHVVALPVAAIDTTGAGDCFVGVLAAALMRGASIPAAMHRAAVAGSLACTIVGAMPSFPTRVSIDATLAGTAPSRGIRSGVRDPGQISFDKEDGHDNAVAIHFARGIKFVAITRVAAKHSPACYGLDTQSSRKLKLRTDAEVFTEVRFHPMMQPAWKISIPPGAGR